MTLLSPWQIRTLPSTERCRIIPLLCLALALTGCGDFSQARGTVKKVGAEKLREETLMVCREWFKAGGAHEIEPAKWPESVRAFQPLGLWAEPDGAYLLLKSDMDGERGVYLPRIMSEKDPLCTPALKHEKFAPGVYWYDRKRI